MGGNRDSKLCFKAKQEFWDEERELIKEGEGTRDWTAEQQYEIMHFKKNGEECKHAGVPKDDDGESFRTHHMDSAEAHPEYQGDGENMQALTAEEHKEAHDGNFKNPTNGEYDIETGETEYFGTDPPTSPETMELSNPIYSSESEEAYGASGDGYDHIGGSSQPSDQEFAEDYVSNLGTNEDNDYDYYNGIF